MKKNIVKKLFVFMGAVSLLSCTNLVDTNVSRNESQEYGSIIIGETDSGERSLDVSTLTSATVTVSGYGMSDITQTDVAISGGKANATIKNIPVGTNRVVTVKSNVDGVTIRAVCDVKAGENSVNVTWSTTAVGNIFYRLIKKGSDVSSIEKTAFDSVIDDSVHASLIDAEKIADDYPSLEDASSYVSDYGTVSVSTSNAAGYTVQITDIASEKKSISGSSDSFTLKAYPGTWKAWVLDSTGTKVAEKDITVVSGETSYVDVKYGEISSFDGIQIQVAKSLNYPKIHYWSCSDTTTYPNTKWPGVDMDSSISDADYIYNFEGCNKVSLLITNSSENKLCSSDISITEKGAYRITSSGKSSSEFVSNGGGEYGITLTVNSPVPPAEAVKIYVSSTSGAPTLWAWTSTYKNITTAASYPGVTMTSATDLNDNSGWYVAEMDTEKIDTNNTEAISFIINSGSDIVSTKTTTFWYDAAGLCGAAGTYYDSDPTTVPEPVTPTVKISPANGNEVGPTEAITIIFNYGNDEENFSASVTINGTTYARGTDFNGSTFSKLISSLSLTDGTIISVSASCENSAGNASDTASLTYNENKKEDTFTWDNVNCYFVLTDRFYNGDENNDSSYGRVKTADGVASFHGGDIKGLTDKLDYFDDLGVNAIWISAPYEQMHGWTSGAGNAFAHYAFHGYYTQDWTFMDQAMGTIEEFRTFVNEAHKRGIRVVMDVVMNHTGYDNWQDMIDYGFGGFKDSYTTYNHAAFATNGTWTKGGDGWGTDWDTQEGWFKWWAFWVRGFDDKSWPKDDGVGYWSPGSGDELAPLVGLPDVVTEKTATVNLPTFLKTKWNGGANSVTGGTNVGELNNNTSVAYGNNTGNKYKDYQLPSVSEVDWYGKTGDWRTDGKGAQADYQIIWLSGWVREFGVDGFRCDTAKHVGKNRWGQLKTACQSALEAWRNDSSKEDTAGAKNWDENFWMTGEHFDWNSHAGQGDYYTTGGFDSMINFAIGGRNNWDGGSYHSPAINTSTWEDYLGINNNSDSDDNGNRNNVLTYISSHDTRLGRWDNQKNLGTMFVLLPGGIQIYYGDESAREKAFTTCGDGDMMTRGDFNWSYDTSLVTHWGKVGTFRKFNPAVGAGTGSATKRTYSGSAGESKVAIGISGTSVDVSGLWEDGTTVYNWYDGTSTTVSGGSVTFTGGTTSQPILVSDKNPSKYGVTF